MDISEQIQHHREMSEAQVADGYPDEAAYHLGLANGLVRWRSWMQRVGNKLDKRRVTLLWVGEALYVRVWDVGGVFQFERVAGVGSDEIRATVRDGIAYRAGEVLGPVVRLKAVQTKERVADAVSQVAAANV